MQYEISPILEIDANGACVCYGELLRKSSPNNYNEFNVIG